MVAISLVGVVTATAVPWMTRLRSETGLPTAQRDVMSALYIARSTAIAYNSPRSVVITPTTKMLVINDPGGNTIYSRNLSSYGPDLNIAGTSVITITFDGCGLLRPQNGPITITLNGIANQSKTITVYGTGKASAS